MKTKLKMALTPLLQPLFAIGLALVVGALAILITKQNPLKVYAVMLNGAFGSKYYLLATLTRATPVIICGLGSALCWSTNYMGIGGEGQAIIGGFFCTVVALFMPGPMWLRFICAVLTAAIMGGLYSAVSAWLLDKFKMSLAISTLMFNYVANYVTQHFVANHLQDINGDIKLTQTAQIDAALRLPRFSANYSFHWGFVGAVLLVIIMWFVMNRTKFGYEAKMSGFNIKFSDYGGVGSKKIMYLTLTISGAICALAGVSEAMGVQYRYVHRSYISDDFAWIGLNAALISGYNPIGILLTSIVLAGVQTGGSAIARSCGIPMEISSIIQGCITLFISARIVIRWRRRKKAAQIANPSAIAQGGNGQ